MLQNIGGKTTWKIVKKRGIQHYEGSYRNRLSGQKDNGTDPEMCPIVVFAFIHAQNFVSVSRELLSSCFVSNSCHSYLKCFFHQQHQRATSECGTPQYMAPEMSQGRGYSFVSILYLYNIKIIISLFYENEPTV
jgi:serine/threonine protein kinase